MAEEETTLSESVVEDSKEADRNSNPGLDLAMDETMSMSIDDVGAGGGKGEGEGAGNVSETVNVETEPVEVESSSQAEEDVEDALDVSKTTTELSSELNDVNDENVRMKLRVLELEHQVMALKAEIAEATANNINCRNKMGQFKVKYVDMM